VRKLAIDERLRNNADRLPARRQHGIGDNSHESHAAATEHQTDVTRYQFARQPFGGKPVRGAVPCVRAAEHRHTHS